MTETPSVWESDARAVGKWPTVVGFTHDGGVYCVDCALEHTPITEEHFDCNQEDMPRDSGVIFGKYQEEWDYTPHCGVCGSVIPEQTVLQYC